MKKYARKTCVYIFIIRVTTYPSDFRTGYKGREDDDRSRNNKTKNQYPWNVGFAAGVWMPIGCASGIIIIKITSVKYNTTT